MKGRHAITVTPNSSRSSRTKASASVSPVATLPPGNSQRPAMCLPAGRSAIRTRCDPAGAPRSKIAPATTQITGLADARQRPVAVLELLARATRTRLVAADFALAADKGSRALRVRGGGWADLLQGNCPGRLTELRRRLYDGCFGRQDGLCLRVLSLQGS